MFAYIINMDNAVDRWTSVESRFRATGIPFERFPAVNGRKLTLPIPGFSEPLYRRRHGKRPNLGQLGCYLSHVHALKKFLSSDHEIGIIAEDDIALVDDLKLVLERAIRHVKSWDILRLSGFHDSHPRHYVSLGDGLGENYSLAVNFSRLSGTGAYMVTRKAAEVLSKALIPMTVPIDHAIDREWAYGLRAASIDPLPVDQESLAFASQLRAEDNEKLPALQRYWTVFPYRARNEITRFFARAQQLKNAKAAVKV
jgi:glycosyl transferase, family 25